MNLKQLLTIILMIFLFKDISCQTKKFKYEICGGSLPIDSSIKVLEKDIVFIIADEFVYKLQIINENHLKILSQQMLYNWSKDIVPPIHMIRLDEAEPDSIGLVNCDSGKEWKISISENQYKSVAEKGCGSDGQKWFEYLFGKVDDHDERGATFGLIYVISDGRRNLKANTNNLIRSNDSSENPAKFIKWVYDTPLDFEYNSSFPFISLKNNTISAGFIIGTHWYLIGGPFYCRVKINIYTYEECSPSLINELIDNCDEMVTESEDKTKGSKFPLRFVILLVLIIASLFVILCLFYFIYRQISTKSNTPKTSGSTGLSN